ncbi:MAG TPA: NADH-quinone oxidoreductase subunit NuoF [Gaiellales bacterium]|jgi:NADH-quinone oxidoreductase subunit F|nr:NADH-quinone oxidoreductase subunit NuoF [Gaiellales bacterium]
MTDTGRILLDFDGDRRDVHAYEQAGGYASLRTALGMAPGDVIAAVDGSGLRGRGGAGFPTGRKASFLPADKRPAYLCVNADESEPGTFKDREIMLRNPHALIEGLLIMSYAIGAASAFVYIRGEYRTEFEVLRRALEEAHGRGYVGLNVLGSGYNATVVLHRGAGAYICGEETALLSSLEGERGQPRSKPPFPAVAGLYAAPTLVNNVETLASVPFIMAMGAEAYAAIGTERSKGTRVFSLSGNVKRPGNYELPLTSTLRDLIEGCGGGAPEGRTIKAIIPGGSSTPILMPDQLDTGIDYESIAAAGSMAGSGAIVVIDDRTCMVQLALRVAEFYRHESCGKCTPCREGTKWGVDIIRRIEMGEAGQGDLDLLLNVCDRILGKCLCPLGDAMAMPVASYVTRFRDEFQRHIDEGGCPFADSSPIAPLYHERVGVPA